MATGLVDLHGGEAEDAEEGLHNAIARAEGRNPFHAPAAPARQALPGPGSSAGSVSAASAHHPAALPAQTSTRPGLLEAPLAGGARPGPQPTRPALPAPGQTSGP